MAALGEEAGVRLRKGWTWPRGEKEEEEMSEMKGEEEEEEERLAN